MEWGAGPLAAELEHLSCQAESGKGLITWPKKGPLWFGVDYNFLATSREARGHLFSSAMGVQALHLWPPPLQTHLETLGWPGSPKLPVRGRKRNRYTSDTCWVCVIPGHRLRRVCALAMCE